MLTTVFICPRVHPACSFRVQATAAGLIRSSYWIDSFFDPIATFPRSGTEMADATGSVCCRRKTDRMLNRTLFTSGKTRQNANCQGIHLFQASNITKKNKGLVCCSCFFPAFFDVCTIFFSSRTLAVSSVSDLLLLLLWA